jgi:hypothetical protein
VAGRENENRRNWWNGERETVTVRGSEDVVFLLGHTSRTAFDLDASITQGPFTGDVGLFGAITRM